MRRERRSGRKDSRSNDGAKGRRSVPTIEPLAESPSWGRWALAALIVVAAVVVYWNTLDNEFVTWDDADYVYHNPLLKGGLGEIWTEAFKEKSHEQYYPLVFTSFWIEHHFVGIAPKLYHATQIALHAANAALLFFVLRWLGVRLPAAALTAALFAVHPINVASVAWVTERKNTLSGFFCLAALLLYLQYRRGKATWRYWASLGAFLLALLSKTAIVLLPALFIVGDRILDRRWSKASFARAIPYFFLAFVMAMVTIHIEKQHSKSGEPIDPALRPLVACAAVVHYVGKLVWPTGFLPIYPRWPVSFGAPRYWISLAAILVAVILLLRFRKRLSEYAPWCVAMFFLPLAPAIGLIHFNLMQYTFVADHLVYLSAIGVFLAIALVLDRLFRIAKSPPDPGLAKGAVFIVAAAAILGGLTIRQNRVWHDGVSLWECTLSGNPDCVPANLNLGNHYSRNKDYEKAIPYYREAARLIPDHVNTPRWAAECCRSLGRQEEAIEYFQESMRRAEKKNPHFVTVHLEYAAYLVSLGRSDEARAVYEFVLTKDPRNSLAKKGLDRLNSAGTDPNR